MNLLQKFWHVTLRVPYTLHTHERRRVKKATHTLVFLHGVGSSGAAWKEVTDGLKDQPVNVIVLDLLGFGKSPKPNWATYDAPTQARAVAKTIAVAARTRRVILVGHSMGALVAVEYAKRYETRLAGLLLASPPLYDDKTNKYLPDRDDQLKALYQLITRYPKQIVMISRLARKYGLVGREFSVDSDTVDEYIGALKASVINQTSLEDIRRLRLPIFVTYGSVDPFVIGAHIKTLARQMPNLKVKTFIGAHEVEGRYVPLLVRSIKDMIARPKSASS